MKTGIIALSLLALATPSLAEMWVSPLCSGAALCVLDSVSGNWYCRNAHHMTGTPAEPLIQCTAPPAGPLGKTVLSVPLTGQVPGARNPVLGPAGTAQKALGTGLK